MKLNDLSLRLAAGVSAFVLMNAPASAQNLADTTANIEAQMAGIPSLLAYVAYVAGAGLGMAGVFKLKQHVDSPQQVPMKDGLARLGVGATLLALPFLLTMLQNTFSSDSGAGTFSTAPTL